MCRLYGFMSNARRKVECELIHSQNGLLVQSRRDERGQTNADGWGLGTYLNGLPVVTKEIDPAFSGDAFRWAAANVESRDVLAHIRRATVGRISLANTHPFVYRKWMFSHNGDLAAFERLQPRILGFMGGEHGSLIEGTTDSEHVFHMVMAEQDRRPQETGVNVLAGVIRTLVEWSHGVDPNAEAALNVMWTDGKRLIGSRLGRSLWFVERTAVHPCQVCGGEIHISEMPDAYRAVVVASERITTDEEWHEVPEGSVYEVGPELRMYIKPMF